MREVLLWVGVLTITGALSLYLYKDFRSVYYHPKRTAVAIVVWALLFAVLMRVLGFSWIG